MRDRIALDEALACALGRALAAEWRAELAAESVGVQDGRAPEEQTSSAPIERKTDDQSSAARPPRVSD